MNDLERHFRENSGRSIHKWTHYFDAYERHFSRFRGHEVALLEIGVAHGGSIQMWKKYFGPGTRIYGIDVDPRCKDFEEPGVEIFIGSQSDREFLREVAARIPDLDILIDDGGHTMRQQTVTFEEMFEKVKSTGLYVCEDLHTSYWLEFGGGHRRRGTFIELAKTMIDQLNAFHSEQRSLRPDDFTRSVSSLHFYDSMLFIEKEPRGAPKELRTGPSDTTCAPPATGADRIRRRARRQLGLMLRALRAPTLK